MGMKLTAILVMWVLLVLQQNANSANIRKGNGETYKLIGVSKPRVTIGDNAIVRAGSSVEIKCPVDVTPEENPSISWELNGNRLSFDSFNTVGYPNIRRYTEMTITIYNISQSDAATYACILEYTSGSQTQTDSAESTLQIAPDCPESCQGVRGEKGYLGSRGQEGTMGRPGLPGICYPEECPKPQMGAKGEPGATGLKGNQGPDGNQGGDGDNGDDGENGMKGELGNKGEDGDQGETGDKGQKGNDGSKGLEGVEGEEGVTGDRGTTGEKGMQGDQGPTGKGDQGSVGADGNKGESGDQGDNGVKGITGEKGTPGSKGSKGDEGNKGGKGGVGEKGQVGKRIMILSLNSTFNSDCSQYELGQIVYDTVIDRFVYCDGSTFQCIRDKPCFDECDPNEMPILTETEPENAKCVSLIYVIDESASMGPEHIWLAEVSRQIPVFLQEINFVPSVICDNNFGVLRFGADTTEIGRELDLGGVMFKGENVELWGTTEELVEAVSMVPSPFRGQGRLEDGYAAIYRALQLYRFIYPTCRRILLITDEDRDNLTPTSDPEATRIPTLLNQNMEQTLKRFSIVLSAVVNLSISIDASYGIPSNRILAILPDNKIVYVDGLEVKEKQISDGIELEIPDGTEQTQNTKDTYYQMVKATGGILWSLPVSREFRDNFTAAFFIYEVRPTVPFPGEPEPDTCEVIGCKNCSCINGVSGCEQIEIIDFDITNECRPTECNKTQILDGVRQPSCVDMVFAVAETRQMDSSHENVKDVATNLVVNLAEINFGQENSLCQNQYCLMTFGEDNGRVPDVCYARSFSPSSEALCGTSDKIGPFVVGFDFEGTGQASDGYTAIYSALEKYTPEFQTQSCKHITLITNGPRSSCGSFQNDDIVVPDLDKNAIQALLTQNNVILNVIVKAAFEDGEGNDALGIYKDSDGTVKALVAVSGGDSFEERNGGKVTANSAQSNIDSDYVMLALSLRGSAWNIDKMGTETNIFTKAFVSNVVIKSSLDCGETQACVECRCVSGTLQRCVESSACVVGVPPDLEWTSGNRTISTDNQVVRVGGYGPQEEKVYYGLDGDLVSTFTISSRLRQGTQPVNVTWYYIDQNGQNIPIENSPVANFASVSPSNPYNLVFSQVGDNIQGNYLLVAENAYGSDTQITNIGILPKWDKTVTGTVTGTQAQLGQTLVASTGSELRITGTVREGTRAWDFKWFHNGVELIQGQDYSFQFSDTSDQATIIIHNFQSQDAGSYTAVVSNRYGQDTHSFNIIVQTIVSCNNDPLNTDTTCVNCQPSQQLRQAALTVYAHSFAPNIQLTWYRIANGQREAVSVQNIVNGANQLIVPISDLCVYTYEVVITGQNTYRFQCACDACVEPDGTTLDCCSANQTLLTESDCGDDYYADILLLIDVSASMDTEHAFLEAFLPRFERDLRDNCVGNSSVNQNQYTAIAFGSQQSEGKENPYFVGPNLNRGDSTQNVFFTIDINDVSNVTDTIAQLPTIGEREDGYAATNFAIKFAQLRENSIKFAFLVTDELRTFFYRSEQEIIDSSTLFNNFADLGRSLYVDLLRTNNVIPIQIIDVTLSSGSTQCLGVSSAETCFYRAPGSTDILRLENTEVVNTAPNDALKSIHKDYLETALMARGYVWDLKVIRQNQTGNWDAISSALTSEVLTRATEELTQCRNCRCLPGGRQCTIVPVDEQARCKCEKNFPGNAPYCDCIVQPDARVDYCRCRFIHGFTDAFCQEIGNVDIRT